MSKPKTVWTTRSKLVGRVVLFVLPLDSREYKTTNDRHKDRDRNGPVGRPLLDSIQETQEILHSRVFGDLGPCGVRTTNLRRRTSLGGTETVRGRLVFYLFWSSSRHPSFYKTEGHYTLFFCVTSGPISSSTSTKLKGCPL